ncbi:PREDICTED: lipase 3-like [Ceratosolen solmsi marchali]|uniref:Lipase n=1 Tax=Ceratosolen solmsi marchali TaxID=326594 RepID=A0AAJ7DW25_9HYME|nr:PREDICTED: lipase 3-like [Ceratosolen solmsi marchali]
MEKVFVIVTQCLITFAAAQISNEILPPGALKASELIALDTILPNDLNFTELLENLGSNHHSHTRFDVVQIIKSYNYSVETHTVQTEDGYILELNRITGRIDKPSPKVKQAVLLQHGLLCSSMDWVLAGPKKGLGFILSDIGYDVWLGNVRGSRYSRKHNHYTVEEAKYWNFDWHEIGLYDLPTMIDYILIETGHKKLFYIGHSQGSTAFFVMASLLPEYNDKIHAMFSLAPIAFCSRMFSPVFQFLSRIIKPVNLVANFIGLYEFKPSDAFFTKFVTELCQDNSALQPICMNAIFLITGFNWDQFDTSLLPAIISNVPAGASVRQFIHYAQIIKSGYFVQYDHGLWGNIQKYGKVGPPTYNLKNVKAPVSLHYSINDWLSHPNDVQSLYSKLPNPIGKFRVVHDNFNHLDYLWAKDVKILLYNKIISIMLRYKD